MESLNIPAHSSRAASLGVEPGKLQVHSSFKTVRASTAGLANRKEAWLHLANTTREGLHHDQTRYSLRLSQLFDRCQGCAALEFSHISCAGASWTPPIPSTWKDIDHDHDHVRREAWLQHVFIPHAVSSQEHTVAIRRLVLVLGSELDLECFPLIDLICLLSLYLDEIETYGVVRRLVLINSTEFRDLPRSGSFLNPRKMFVSNSRTSWTSGALFDMCLKKIDGPLHRQVQQLATHGELDDWFQRLLIPILPMNMVLRLLDCLVAGSDLRSLFRVAYWALVQSKPALLSSRQNRQLTELVRESVLSKSSSAITMLTRTSVWWWKWFPTRRKLRACEKSLAFQSGTRIEQADSVIHVPRRTFDDSKTVLTYEAATRLCRIVPPSMRYTTPKLHRVFSTHNLVASTLADLYSHCATSEYLAVLIVVSSPIPSETDSLERLGFDSSRRSPSTDFSDKEEGNYIVFGFYTQARLDPRAPAPCSDSWTSQVFRLAPRASSRTWSPVKCKFESHDSVISCTRNCLVVGDTTCPALMLDQDLTQGSSGWCGIFESEPLCIPHDHPALNQAETSKRFYFRAECVEVFGLPRM